MSRITRPSLIGTVLLLALATGAALQLPTAPASLQAQGQSQNPAEAIRARYTKYEYQIPMRDGVKL
jgi:uncharacterized protein